METANLKVEIFLPLYVSDYDRDTADLSFEEHGFYGAILRALWVRGGVLHLDDRQRVARILRTDVTTFDRLWPAVAHFFTIAADGRTFSQKRLSTEMEKARARKADASRAGLASADARRFRAGSAQPQSTAARTDESTDVQRPSEREAEPPTEPKTNTSPSPSPSPAESESPSESSSRRSGSGARARWTPAIWIRQFGIAWGKTYEGRFYGGGAADGIASGKLSDILKELPEAETRAAEERSETMFAEFLADQTPPLVRERHPFSFFVQRWNGLRHPALAARGSAGGKPRDVRVGSIAAPGKDHKYPNGAQPL
jgi:uncharacterized protein YdaU (DUF1376 family)